jgi:hypothetical protein
MHLGEDKSTVALGDDSKTEGRHFLGRVPKMSSVRQTPNKVPAL